MKNKLTALLTNPHFHNDIQVMKKLDTIDCAYITISGRFDEEVRLDGEEPEFKAINREIKKMKKRWAKLLEERINNNFYE